MFRQSHSRPRSSESASVDTPHRKPRNLVLCFDGTGQEFSNRNTNVVKLYSMLKKDHPDSQVSYYQECLFQSLTPGPNRTKCVLQAGIGTYFQPGVVSSMFCAPARVLDEMFAWYLSEHIIDGYKFLMQNYHKDDKIYLFGFSRGAYTARALAGMLHKVGLLSKDNFQQVPFAYKIYKTSNRKSHKLADRFKKAFSYNVTIEFLGVWDTVASVGVLNGRTLPFVGSNNMIKVFRQALSLDEHRAKFRPNLYHQSVAPRNGSQQKKPLKRRLKCWLNILERTVRSPDTLSVPSRNDPAYKDVLEVWFAGCHSDIGGGNTKDSKRHALSHIPLRWMVREVVNAGCDIFDPAALDHLHIPPEPEAIERPSEMFREGSSATYVENVPPPAKAMFEEGEYRCTPETEKEKARHVSYDKGVENAAGLTAQESLDAKDALEKIRDSLKRNYFWWILEIFPTYYKSQNENGEWVGKLSCHWGRGRKVPDKPIPTFHKSVKTRMEDPYLRYSPRAQYSKDVKVNHVE